jgi:hypothetical protein
MRILFLSFLLFVSSRGNTQILFAGNHVLEGYLGMPNMTRFSGGINFITAEITEGEVSKFKGLAPSGIRYSYLLTENVSFGFDLIYNKSDVTRSSTDTLYNGITGQWVYETNLKREVSTRLRFHARINFHISTGLPESDSYFGIGFGTNNRWIKSYKNNELDKLWKGSEASILPFSMRICYGYRYFFGYNWGISGEVGLGGPLLSIGVSYKV